MAIEYRLHLGAHKTATTYIQRKLDRNAERLAQSGVRFVGPEEFRTFDEIAMPRTRRRSLRGLFRIRAARRALSRRLRAIEREGLRRIVISEENLSGSCRQIVKTGRIYGYIGQRMRVLPRRLGRSRTVIFLAIRSYPDFLAACHAQTLRTGYFKPFERYRRNRMRALPSRWPDVIDDIRRTLPRAKIVIWRYEDFGALEDAIFERMTGLRAGDIEPLEQRPMRSLSAEGVKRIAAAAERGRVDEVAMRRIVRETSIEAGYERYDPWESGERTYLEAAYAQDCAELAQRTDIEFLRP